MKIRLMGAPDLVRRWAAELEREYGVKGREYANTRTNDGQVRFYLDLDDRVAERIIDGLSGGQGSGPKKPPGGDGMKSANPKKPKRPRTSPKKARATVKQPPAIPAPSPALEDFRRRLERLNGE